MANVSDMMRSMFGSGNQQTNQNQGNPAPPGNSAALENGGKNATGDDGKPPAGDAPVNPLDKFKDIWQPPVGADGKPIPKKDTSVFGNIDHSKIVEAAGKQDFSKFVKPETLAAIAKGGPEAQTAFTAFAQDFGTNLFAMSASSTTQLIEKALATQRTQFQAELPGILKSVNLGENLRTKNPVLDHPAARPIVDGLKRSLTARYPDATAAELQTMAEEYFTTFASSMTPKQNSSEEGSKGSRSESQDWSEFLPDYLKSSK